MKMKKLLDQLDNADVTIIEAKDEIYTLLD